MQNYHSEKRIKKEEELSLPKIRSQSINLLSAKKQPRLSFINKFKRQQLILKQTKLGQNILKNQDSMQLQSDSSAIMRNIITPQNKKHAANFEVAVLSLNKNHKERVKKRFVQETFVGEEAIQKYYEHYKHFDRYKLKEQFMREDNPLTHIIQLLENHSFAPRRLDLIKLKGSHAILDLKQLGLGRGQLGSVVSQLVNYLGHFQYIDLSSNGIDATVSESLVEACLKCKIVNISYNRIGKRACDKFAEIFLDHRVKIQELYLADNHLSDNAGYSIINSLIEYGNLRVLNLNKNFLTHKTAVLMKQYLEEDHSLEELYLGWNEFGDKSAKLIFEGVEMSETLKVLDYSWNLIGIFSVNAVSKALKQNQTLLHVDISFCDIDKKNSEIIGKALDANHTIYGIHFQGNSGFVDERGYIKVTPKQFNAYPLPIIKGLIRSIDSVRPNPIQNQYKETSFRDICWICSSWQQVFLKIRKTNQDIKECHAHFSSENFKATKMVEQDGYFTLYRMCPISQIKFFFTAILEKKRQLQFCAEQYPQINNTNPLQFSLTGTRFLSKISKLNTFNNVFVQDVVDEAYFPNVHCQPRTHEVLNSDLIQTKKVIIKVKKKVVRESYLQIKYRQLDFKGGQEFLNDSNDRDSDQDYLIKCLEFDIRNSKINRLIKKAEDIASFKQMMLKYYRNFKDVFYYLASTYPAVSGIYSISEQPFQGFLDQQKYITKRVTHAKVMIKMYSCLSFNDDESMSPQKKSMQSYKLFSRPQFLQFLIRLALQKWCTTIPQPRKKKEDGNTPKIQENQFQSPSKLEPRDPLPLIDGIEKTMKTLHKYAFRVRNADWRKVNYLVIDNYTVIKGYDHFLNNLFQSFGNDKAKVDKPKKIKGLITLDEVKKIMTETGIKRTKEEAKDCDVQFLSAKRLQIEDGLLQFGLNFDEFCEFLARYSQIVWFPPVECENHELWNSEQIRLRVPLFLKFQALIVNIYRRLPQFHNRKMKVLTSHGLFQQQNQILLEKLGAIQINTKSDLWTKINQGQQKKIGLQDLISGLRQKYENVKVLQEQEISEEEERQQIDY